MTCARVYRGLIEHVGMCRRVSDVSDYQVPEKDEKHVCKG